MSANSLQNLAIDRFRAACAIAWQTGSKLRMAVDEYTGIEALTYQLPSTGYVDTTERDSTNEVQPDDAGSWKPVVTLGPAESFTYVDKQDQAITNAQWMARQGEIRGKAVGRRYDGLILQAAETWDSAAYSGGDTDTTLTLKTGDVAIVTPERAANKNAGATITSEVLAQAVGMLIDRDVGADDPESCFFVIPATQFHHLAGDLKNGFWNYSGGGVEVTQRARFQDLYGCTPIVIGNMARRAGHGRIPDNRAYVWAKSSLALCLGTTEELGVMEWVPHRRSWMIGAETNAGAGRQMNNGIVKINIAA